MATLTDNEVAVIDLQDLHDIFASGIIAVTVEDGDFARPSEFKLVDDQAGTEDHVAVERLNQILRMIQDLDGEFHDRHNSAYC